MATKGTRRFRRDEASKYLEDNWGLHYAKNTLAKLATIGGGPAMEYASRFPTYTEAALDAFAKSKIGPSVRSTSERKALQREERAAA